MRFLHLKSREYPLDQSNGFVDFWELVLFRFHLARDLWSLILRSESPHQHLMTGAAALQNIDGGNTNMGGILTSAADLNVLQI